MPGYWWTCENCKARFDFDEACGSKGIAHFIWDVMLASSWDQSTLLRKCKKCGNHSLRITYDFPRTDKETIRVIHIVGIGPLNKTFLPMMWETYPIHIPSARWFDFKYIDDLKHFGLNRPAVFSREGLRELFEIYCVKTGSDKFP